MKRFLKSLSLMLALGGATACGDDLVDATYTGEPRYVLSGEVQSLGPASSTGKTRITLAWDNWVRNGDITSFQDVELSSHNPPFDYRLRLMEDPPTTALNDFGAGLMGTAYVMVYQDEDGDRQPSGQEPTRGIAPGHIVLFAPALTPEFIEVVSEGWGRVINPEALQPGYNLARGICATEELEWDDLLIVPNEPVPVSSMEDANETGCINFH